MICVFGIEICTNCRSCIFYGRIDMELVKNEWEGRL